MVRNVASTPSLRDHTAEETAPPPYHKPTSNDQRIPDHMDTHSKLAGFSMPTYQTVEKRPAPPPAEGEGMSNRIYAQEAFNSFMKAGPERVETMPAMALGDIGSERAATANIENRNHALVDYQTPLELYEQSMKKQAMQTKKSREVKELSQRYMEMEKARIREMDEARSRADALQRHQIQANTVDQPDKASSAVPTGPAKADKGNPALQEFQMQLMLLEQQNKKRLSMARAAQDPFRLDDSPSQSHQSQQTRGKQQEEHQPFVPLDLGGPKLGDQAAREYELQLALLEAQNKRALSTSGHLVEPASSMDPVESAKMQAPFVVEEKWDAHKKVYVPVGAPFRKTVEAGSEKQHSVPWLSESPPSTNSSFPTQMPIRQPNSLDSREEFGQKAKQFPEFNAGWPAPDSSSKSGPGTWGSKCQGCWVFCDKGESLCGWCNAKQAHLGGFTSTSTDPSALQEAKDLQQLRAEMAEPPPTTQRKRMDCLREDPWIVDHMQDFQVPDPPSKPGKKKKAKKSKQSEAAKIIKDAFEAPPSYALNSPRATSEAASVYCKPFLDFMTENPTVFHAVDWQKKQLLDLGWTALDERDKWDIVPGGKYFVERNGSAMIAFSVGENYKSGNGCAIIAGHVDALTAKLKPISEVPNKAGYLQLGVAPYAGALNDTWWDRDLGVGGRVLVREDGKIVTKLVKLDWPIARIPTLAPHFGAAAAGPFNKETQMVPIVGLEDPDDIFADRLPLNTYNRPSGFSSVSGPKRSFVETQPPGLVKAIGEALGLTTTTYSDIAGWELELFDVQPATVGGLNKEFIFAGRIDDKLCSWAAMQALTSCQQSNDADSSSIIKMVGWFDNEEIGSQLRQGAKSNFLPLTIERVVGCLGQGKKGANLVGRTYANSFLLSSDVTHAVNPNFLNAYMEHHSPRLNVGLSVHADPNGNMTTDAISTAILQRCAEDVGAKLQVFQIRNDSRSGGTVGPMLSSMTGIRAIDAGIPQLSMHSIRAATGNLDPGLGVITYIGFLNRFEHVDKEFRS